MITFAPLYPIVFALGMKQHGKMIEDETIIVSYKIQSHYRVIISNIVAKI